MLTLEYLKDKAEQLQKVTGCLLCIAGGAPRDILNDRPVNDIDIFLNPSADTSVSEILEVLSAELEIAFKHITGKPDASDPGNATVYEGQWEGHKWQFIFKYGGYESLASFVEETLHSFDYGVCQVAMVPYDESYTCTEAYITDADHSKLTRNPHVPIETYRTEKAVKRLQKLQEKYPDFTVEPLPPREVNRDDSLERQRQILAEFRREAERMRLGNHNSFDTPQPIPQRVQGQYQWYTHTGQIPTIDSTDWMTTTVTTRRA